MNSTYYISVIIPTYHDWRRLQLCLNELDKQTMSKDRFEVIVVNNDPDDEPPTSLHLPDNARLICEAKPGSYAARNAAIAVARGDIFAFTDSDCIPYSDWLESGYHALISGSHQRIGGRVELFYLSDRLTLAEIFEKTFAFPQQRYTEAGAAVTANMMAYKTLFEKVGLFNESLLSGGDIEWGKRAFELEFPIVYAEDATVKHPARYKLSELFKKHRRVITGQVKLVQEGNSSQQITGTFLSRNYAKIKTVLARTDLNAREKIISLFLVYALATYKRSLMVFSKLGLIKARR